MIDIQAPDGTIARFPDGMSDDAITAVMRQHYPPPAPTSASGGVQSPLGRPMPTAADLAAKGVGVQPGIGAEMGGLNDVVRSAANGMTLGLGDRIAAGAGAATGIGGQKGDYAGNLAKEQAQTQQFQTQHPVVSAAANMAGTGLTGAVLPLAQPATALGRLLMGMGVGAGVGAVQNMASSPDLTNIPDTLKRAKEGGELGILGGAAAPLAGSLIGHAITPLPVGLPRATDVAFLKQAGIPLSAGQISGYKPLHVLESVLSEMPLSGGGAQKLAESQNQAFTSALLARAGVEGDRTDPASMDAAFNSVGDVFKRLSGGSTMTKDSQFGEDINGALDTYTGKVSPANTAPLPAKLVGELQGAPATDAQGDAVPGDAYQAQRSSLSNDANSMRFADPPQAQFYRELRDAMDNAMTRSIPQKDAADWVQARQNWGNLKDIGKAAAGAGSDTAAGFVSPQKMRSVIASGNNRIDYARGKGDFDDLVRAGNAVMTPFPNSGTAGRINAMHMIGLLGGGGLGGMEGGFPGAAVGALAAPAIAGHTLMSRPVQGYLGNQLLPVGIHVPTLGSAVGAALAARQGRQ